MLETVFVIVLPGGIDIILAMVVVVVRRQHLARLF